MAQLASPGVSTNIIDNSFYTTGISPTVPLVYIATGDEKMQDDGVTPALGTYEYNVLRQVTSVNQALQLFGTPKFLTDANGNPQHGDARNEYGLDAVIKALGVSNVVYVIRANVNLNDDITSLKNLWIKKIDDASDYLEASTNEYITQYNSENGCMPTDPCYITTVDAAVAKNLVADALIEVFSKYSFSKPAFQDAFLLDHTVAAPGYQDVKFDTTYGQIQVTDVTGAVPTVTYSASITIDGVAHPISALGSTIATYGNLIDVLNSSLGSGVAEAELLNGSVRITSATSGATSTVLIVDTPNSTTPTSALFASLNLYAGILPAINGKGPGALPTYNADYSQSVGTYDGLYNALTGTFTPDALSTALAQAATDFVDTKEFFSNTSLGFNDAARRANIVAQLQASINSPSTGATSEANLFDIVVCPGYWECSDELVTLSQACHSEVFVIGDTPFDRPAIGPNGITKWATTPSRVMNDLITYAYGHVISSNVDGTDIMTTAASVMLRTILYSDSVSEKWYAPAGTDRGTVPFATNLGYVSGTLGAATSFVTDYLDNGIRDELYASPVSINPITFIPGRGILVLGQKTSNPITSALDSTNIVRLALYIRRQLRLSLFPYLFQPNDEKTWNAAKYQADTLLNNLVSRRGLYEFASQCDANNNTPGTIDAKELHLDVYIKPTKAVEFIYVNITLVNTGADLASLK